MGVIRSDVPGRLRRKMCLTCGFSGAELQGGAAASTFICPRCATDLYARPARSYAELEGLDGATTEAEPGAGEWALVDGLWMPRAAEPPRGPLARGIHRLLAPVARALGRVRAQFARMRRTRGAGWEIGVRQPNSATAARDRRKRS